MDPTDIFHPVFNMFWLTIAVFLLATALRMKSIYLDKDSPGEDYRPGKRRKPAESPYRPRRPGSPSSQAHGTRQKGPFRAGRKINGVGKRNAATRPARRRTLRSRSFLRQEVKSNR